MPSTLPYSQFSRISYSALWTFYAVVLAALAVALLNADKVGAGLLVSTVSVLCARYVYRLWTWRVRRLMFLIFF